MTGAAEQFDSAGQAIAGVIEDTFDHPGVPDAFQRLWVPHRMVYIGGQLATTTRPAWWCAGVTSASP